MCKSERGRGGALNCSELCPCRSNPPVECCRGAEQSGPTATSNQRQCAEHGQTGQQRPRSADWSSATEGERCAVLDRGKSRNTIPRRRDHRQETAHLPRLLTFVCAHRSC